jgi:mRNA interferase MazF
LKRGAIWTAAGGTDYTGKPRPVVIVQNDNFGQLDSITVCPLTRDQSKLPLFRIEIAPTVENGLAQPSHIMVDKIVTMPKSKLGKRIGALDHADIVRLERAMAVFLGLAG